MKKYYDGLGIFNISLDTNVTNGSDTPPPSCVAMIQLVLENGICISDPSIQQIEYVGKHG